MSSWYTSPAPENDIAVSTRIRLARNLEGLPFPSRMTAAQREEVNQKVKKAILESNTPFAKKLRFIAMKDVPENEIGAMVERHIISPEFAADSDGKAIIISDDETVCVMIGEEDHIRIQVILGGFQLEKAYEIANQIDDLLAAGLSYAFDEQLGFLTECPTNLGTGLRASLMLHLPLLQSSGAIREIADSIQKIGFTVRGMYGEGSKSLCDFFQISNQITLGITEKNALDNLAVIARQIIEKEREERKKVDPVKMEDLVYRALGVLENQRLLSSKEMATLVSRIKMGISMGILPMDQNLPVRILIETQLNMLCRTCGEISAQERDAFRAKKVREMIGKQDNGGNTL